MNNIKRTRIEWIDTAKGLGILLVMLGHLEIDALEEWIYSFHMPMFFFLSGYVFKAESDFFTFLKKKCRTILIPYFFMGFLIILYETIIDLIDKTYTFKGLLEKLHTLLIQIRGWDLWFLASLFWLNIIFFILIKLCRNAYIALAVTILFSYGGFYYYSQKGTGLFWNIDVCFFSLFFFALGYLLKSKFSVQIMHFLKSKTHTLEAFILCWVINIICHRISYTLSSQMLEMYMGTYGIPVLSYTAAVAGTFGVIIFANKLHNHIIRYIGKNSLIYFALHQGIMMPLINRLLATTKLYPFDHLPFPLYILCICAELFVILFSLTAFTRFLNESKLRVLLGKSLVN